jgi:hypothetical protein
MGAVALLGTPAPITAAIDAARSFHAVRSFHIDALWFVAFKDGLLVSDRDVYCLVASRMRAMSPSLSAKSH